MTTAFRIGFTLLFASLAVACHDFHVQTPSEFVELEHSEYDYQATDADGVVLAVRGLDSENAALPFWRQAVKNQLARLGSYELKTEKALRSKDGTPGVVLHYERTASGSVHHYAIALFIKQDAYIVVPQERLFVVEAGGPAEAWAVTASKVDHAIAGLELDLPL
jgi:hypothetical protein